MGAYAGAYKTSKAWRRYGLTILYTVYALIVFWNPWILLTVSIFYPLTRGYGIPEKVEELGETEIISCKNYAECHLGKTKKKF